jgi:cation-transporting ATPase 13A3/4/5
MIAIVPKMSIPCDCILMSGEVLLNEASLTGESIPVPKFPLEHNMSAFSFTEDKRNCIFEGTNVLTSKATEGEWVLALVVRTGFMSFKG